MMGHSIQPDGCDFPGGVAPRVAAASLGCKLNQYETEAVLGQFVRRGFTVAEPHGEADLLLVDTCTVTDRADQKARSLIRGMIRRNPEAVVVVMGCYSQAAAEEIARIPGVDYILGNAEKRHAAELVTGLDKQPDPLIHVGRPAAADDRELLALEGFHRQTRAWLKIQDGCDVFCSFCVIPFTRGRSRSMDPAQVLAQASRLLEAGHLELVLTGVHMGDFGRDLEPRRSLAWLIHRLLELPGLLRLRLSSIEPWDISDELLAAMASDPRVCPHLHTALQSGSDEVLAAMRRRIDRRGILDLYERIQRHLPGAGLGTDLICGFPGEEDRHHRETLELIQCLPLTYLHVFPYSERQGTRAASLPGAVPRPVRKARSRDLLDVGVRLQAAAHARVLGRPVEILPESWQEGPTAGYTADYLRVVVEGGPPDSSPADRAPLLTVIPHEDAGDHLLARRAALPA